MAVRGIRGAITVPRNDKGEIISATRELLQALVVENGLEVAEIASALFSTTRDLNAEFPAVAAREIGWHDTPLLCGNEIDVPGSLPLCVRVLLHVNTDRPQTAMRHVYLREAKNLRR
ncbi:MAG: chorismate mutase [Candidatus Margulisiibacteriota bacterium]